MRICILRVYQKYRDLYYSKIKKDWKKTFVSYIQGVRKITYQKENCISLAIFNRTGNFFYPLIEGHIKFCLLEKTFINIVRTCYCSYYDNFSGFENVVKKLENFVKNISYLIFFRTLYSFSDSILWIIDVFDTALERVCRKKIK